MRVCVLGSGSSGNAIALSAGSSTLLIDAGFGPRTLAKRAKAVGLDFATVEALILTHEHNDHARGAGALAKRLGCAVYGSHGTLAALDGALGTLETVRLSPKATIGIGPFDVSFCPTNHDASQPVALAVKESASGAVAGIAYDVGRPTAGLIALLQRATCLVLEANHDDALLRSGPYPLAVQRRIAGPDGHLSNRAAADLAAQLCHSGLQTVVLAHVSDRCNRPDIAAAAVGEALEQRGFRGRLLVASQAEALEPFEVGPAQYALDVFT